jgi:Skp family chaperone for outer membrane proteins
MQQHRHAGLDPASRGKQRMKLLDKDRKKEKIMRMFFVILITITLFSGCYENTNNSYQFKWATVDAQVLEKEIESRLKRLNPYVSDTGVSKKDIEDERRKLNRQIYRLKKSAKEECISSTKELKQGNNQKNIARYKGTKLAASPRVYMPRQSAAVRACNKQIRSDPLIMDLEQKKDELDSVIREQREHDQELFRFSKVYAQLLIKRFAKSKYEVVVSARDDVVLYNSKGLMLDITDMLIEKIDEKRLVLKEIK